jgi:lysozyme family protein
MGYNSVVMLQHFLNRQINAGLVIDGYMGKKTVKALQTWINK